MAGASGKSDMYKVTRDTVANRCLTGAFLNGRPGAMRNWESGVVDTVRSYWCVPANVFATDRDDKD